MTPPSSGSGRHRAPGDPSTPDSGIPETSGSSVATADADSGTRNDSGADTSSGASRPQRGRGIVLRVVAAVVLVLAWLAGSAVGGPTFGNLSEVSSNDQSTFLPASAESTQAGDWVGRFTESEQIPAIVVARAADGQTLAEDDDAVTEQLSAFGEELTGVEGVDQLIGPQVSEDEQAVEYILLLDAENASPEDTVESLREVVTASAGDVAALDAESVHVAGPAGLAADLAGAFAGIDGILLIVALSVVFVILVLVYRSVLLPILVLLNSVGALCVAVLVVYWMAKWEWIALNGQSQGILSILVIGAATDYSLLMVARYREELMVREDVWEALRNAWKGSFEAITASAATVAVALLCLLFSDLNSNRSLGPIAATGIVLAWLSSLTFLPALLYVARRAAFWPSIPRPGKSRTKKGKTYAQPEFADGRKIAGLEQDHGVWTKIGALVARRPRAVWTITAAVLLAGAVGITQLQASGVAQTDVLLGESDAKSGQELIAEHFDAGTGAPATVVAPAERADEVLSAVEETDGVASAYLTAEGGAPAGTPDPEAIEQLQEEARAAAEAGQGAPAEGAGPPPGVTGGDGEAPAEGAGPPSGISMEDIPTLEPQEVDGKVYLQATLENQADSAEAEQTVVELRETLHGIDDSILVGGTTATALDSNTTAQADLRLIIPLVLLVVLGILMILLRSVLAPVLLVLDTVVSFGTAMGISALVFNHLFQFPGADPSVPLYGFVFLVALGVDYTIFLMTRARQEAVQIGTRPGVLHALTVTGGVITSAGIVLAATFAALAVIPLMFMLQLAFIVAFGVLLDTFLVRSLVVPALTYDIGPKVWWPSKLSRAEEPRQFASEDLDAEQRRELQNV